MTNRMRVLVLFGGRSDEHEVSCVTAGGVLSAIDRELFDVVTVGITREGTFVTVPDDPAALALNPERMPRVRDNASRVIWPSDPHSRELWVRDAEGVLSSLGRIDVVLPLLHGPFGEDGTVQGLLELCAIPFVGSGVLASAACMDKHITKVILEHAGLSVAPWRTVTREAVSRDPGLASRAVAELGLPVFVKPARAGSSVGVSRVESFAELDQALAVAFEIDARVLIEAQVSGREIEISLLGGRDGGRPRASVAAEIIVHDRAFYDYESKYLDTTGVELVCPAALSADELAASQEAAITAFTALDCADLARVDFFLTERGLVVNEVNTMPGFTPLSQFPNSWRSSGIDYSSLITELITLAVNRSAA